MSDTSHYEVLKKLFPLNELGGEIDNDLTIKGKYLDKVYTSTGDLNNQIFPDTAGVTGLLSDYNRILDLGSTGISESQQQYNAVQAIRKVINKKGLLNKQHFINIGIELGYTDVTIYEYFNDMFVLANSPKASALPHAIYNQDHAFIWSIKSLMIPAGSVRAQWEALILSLAPAFTEVLFLYS